MLRWLASHKSLVLTATSGSIVAVLVTVAAVVSGGFTAQRMDLGDASVWVSNTARQYVGRANTDILQLNTVVAVEGTDSTIVQNGAKVIAVDEADARADVIDPATSRIIKTVPLPPEQPSVYLSGDDVVIYSQGTGQLWVVPFASFALFDAEQQPTLNLSPGSIVTVDDARHLYAYSRDTKLVRSVTVSTAASVGATVSSSIDSTGQVSVTTVAGHWVVLDATNRRIEVNGAVTDLSGLVDPGQQLIVQQASSTGDSVLLEYPGGLISVPFGGGAPQLLSSGHTGTPVAPTVLDGCSFAAWGDGTAWRQCTSDNAPATELTLSSVLGTSRLQFQSNGSRIVLNDETNGTTWAVQRNAQVIDNWNDLISETQQQAPVDDNNSTSDTVVEKDQAPPVAVDDQFGARPGRATTLPVLLNDYDPNSDVLVIDRVDAVDESIGKVDLINERQKVQLTLTPSASGEISIGYTISDGRGGTASAVIRITVRTASENLPPRQVRATKTTVEAGAQGSVEVLGDWVDPDGDPFYLTSASVAAPDAVSSGPDGTVVFTAAASTSGGVTVPLVVSDGTAAGTGSLAVTVAAVGKVPLVADPFVVLAYADQQVTITPLAHVRGGVGTIKLNAVPPRAGVTITPSYQAGTFRFESDQVRTHYIDFVVTDDDATVTGTVRIEVQAPPDINSTPITVPKTVFVRTLSTALVNVASTDIDPAGGVLLVSGTSDVPIGSGVKAEIIAQESVRVTLVGLLTGPVSFHYEVTNGLAEAQGTITVIEIPAPSPEQPPIARDDTASARVGDAIVIDALANDDQPDGLDIALSPQLVQGLTGDSGLLFASGGVLRYLAPNHPGNFTAVYQITGPDGQTAQAQVRIQVREANTDTNNPPVPQIVTGRVIAGETVRVDIPLTGIDPDGDSVQLLGQETSPQKGAVTNVGATFIEYQAGDYSAGTDSFTYTVIDALGARATGTVRIGIAQRDAGASNPIATRDEVVARPGSSVSVQVLANDSDPNGAALTVVSATPTDAATKAVIENNRIITITPPPIAKQYAVAYTIENSTGGTSQAYVIVTVSDDAALSYPVANDSILTLTDILGRTTVDVDVLRNVFFADGPSNDLGLGVLPGYGGNAEVLPNKLVRVTVADTSQIIPFVVTHPADPKVQSFALIWIPGLNDALPQLNRKAPALVVDSEAPLQIDLNAYVVAVAGKTVQLTDSSTVQATHANGDSLVVDNKTLRFVSASHYSGPASISFEVTDGTSRDDPNGHTAVLVLPITVNQGANQPPVFTGAVIEFEPAQEKQINLVKLTNYPHPEDINQLVYSVVAPLPVGFSYELSGTNLTIRANEAAVVGTSTALTLGVRDNVAVGQTGRIQLNVVSSTRPLVQPVDDSIALVRGNSTTVNLLANDEATNPFPGQPLHVVSLTGADGGSLPAGVSVQPSNENSTITVSVTMSAAATDSTLQYRVGDATNDPTRYVYGLVHISVQDVPDAPVAPVRVTDEFVNGELKLRITPPLQNNSPINTYSIVSSSHGEFDQDCGTNLICSVTGLSVGAEYRFGVIATNAVGDSVESPLSDVYTVDYKPAAPASVTASPSTANLAPNGKSLTISWPNVPNPSPGTAVVGYTVMISGPGVNYSANATSPLTTTAGGNLDNDASYTVAVYARNSAQVLSDADWRRTTATVRTVGPPSVPKSGPKATINSDNANGEIRVTWGDSNANGAASVTYSVGRVTGTADLPNCSTGPGKPYTDAGATNVNSGWIDTTAVDGQTYTYFVYADNGIYCTPAATGALESKRPPGKALGSVSAVYRSGGQFDLQVNSDLAASGIVARFQYRIDGNSNWQSAVAGQWLTPGTDANHYALPTSVYFRACRDTSDDYCGPESDASTATPVDVRATVTTCVADGTSIPLTSPPNNAGPASVAYAFAYNRPVIPLGTDYAWSDFTYSASDPVPSDAIGVRVRATVTVAGVDYVDDPGFGDSTCAP